METKNTMPFAFTEGQSPTDKSQNIIKVIGVGGGGSNAVQNMYKQGVHNVRFAICNTDSQALAQADVPVKIQLGSAGLGVGGKPEKGKEAAEASLDVINSLFEDDTEMVFITCGMGGGTGTGAAPVIAGLAKEKGILTVGVVTIPFGFEGKVKIRKALQGVEEMRKNVDSLLVINNERLCELYSNEIMRLEDGLAKADEVVTTAAKSISEIITMRGIINRDFCDVQTVMKDGGDAIMSVGFASGENRIGKAFVEALKSPLLNNVEIEKARRMLYIIYSSDEHQVGISELNEIRFFMNDLAEDIEVLWGVYRDNTLGEQVKVALIATDFADMNVTMNDNASQTTELQKLMMDMYYGERKQKVQEVVMEERQETPKEEEVKEEVIVETKVEPAPKSCCQKPKFLDNFLRRLNDVMDKID
jgi:cell division protein FtsZ